MLALIAYFQNNEETNQMVNQIDGISERLQIIMENTTNCKS